jgi:hypothetical protein
MSEEKQNQYKSEDQRRNRVSERARQEESLQGATMIPAIRHIGKTLESDPEYYAVAAPGYSTPEAQIAAEAGPVDVDQRRMEEDDFDPISGRTLENRPEPLRTRLPGDSSSDPHSDLGPDNATNLQQREDARNSGETNRA